jgi:flagellin
MALNDISLTSGMRNNLLSLQNTTTLINRTQTRLSTGKSVNTALDNPTNFFAAQTATARATDLSNRKDGMSEAVQMVSAANAGITGITSLIESAQGVAQAALATTSTTDRASYETTFNTLMTQITELASDSGYRGTNFLNGQNQTVEFAPATSGATLQIQGFDATSTGLGLSTVGTTAGSIDWADSTTGTAGIQSSATQLENALNTLRSQSSTLSANLSVVTSRQSFTDNMVSTLQTGADNLTLADTNQEGANLLMLQTRQSLGITSLSLASQAAQAVLKLF